MTLEIINKWLDEEYGCSYTKLEELHDFYFGKYCDLKDNKIQLLNWLESKNKIILQQHKIVEPVIKVQEVIDKIKEMD